MEVAFARCALPSPTNARMPWTAYRSGAPSRFMSTNAVPQPHAVSRTPDCAATLRKRIPLGSRSDTMNVLPRLLPNRPLGSVMLVTYSWSVPSGPTVVATPMLLPARVRPAA